MGLCHGPCVSRVPCWTLIGRANELASAKSMVMVLKVRMEGNYIWDAVSKRRVGRGRDVRLVS